MDLHRRGVGGIPMRPGVEDDEDTHGGIFANMDEDKESRSTQVVSESSLNPWLWRVVLTVSVSSVTWYTLTLLCIVGYFVAYFVLIPPLHHQERLFFDFDPMNNGHCACHADGDAAYNSCIQPQEELPTAILHLRLANNQWELYDDAFVATQRARQRRRAAQRKNARQSETQEEGQTQEASTSDGTADSTEETVEGETQQELRPSDAALTDVNNPEADSVFDWRLPLRYSERDEVETFRYLTPSEKYDIVVDLFLRDDPVNYDLGVIMVTMELLTSEDKILARSKRSILMDSDPRSQPRSRRIGWLEYLFFWVWYIPPFSSTHTAPVERKHVRVHLFEKVQEQPRDELALNKVRVVISQPVLRLDTAEIHFDVQLEGFAYYL